PPADSAYAAVGDPVDIDPDQVETEITDAGGSSLYWYKWVYFNSESEEEVTELAQVDAFRGEDYGNYATVEDIRVEAGIEDNIYIPDSFVRARRAEAEDVINSALKGAYNV